MAWHFRGTAAAMPTDVAGRGAGGTWAGEAADEANEEEALTMKNPNLTLTLTLAEALALAFSPSPSPSPSP